MFALTQMERSREARASQRAKNQGRVTKDDIVGTYAHSEQLYCIYMYYFSGVNLKNLM